MGLKLKRPVSIGGAEKVCPLEDFGKAELVEGNDDGAYRAFAADDEDFDGFAVGVGVAVEFEGEFEVDWLGGVGVEDAGTVAGGGGLVLHKNLQLKRQIGCQNYSVNSDCVNPFDAREFYFLWKDRGMGKAGAALKQVLETYNISQYSLAAVLDVERNNVYRWANEKRDPSAETVVEIVRALKSMHPEAAEEFVRSYLGNEL
jgi:DNA-binding XRE family transcriptional regulator